MALRARLLASASFLISSVCVNAWAQTPPSLPTQPSTAGAQPAATIPAPQPAPAATSPAAVPAAAQSGGNLPTITVSAKRKEEPRQRASPVNATGRSTSTTPTPAPPSPFETGAPNVAGGTAVVPQLASQMTISGQDLNARPVLQPAEILEAAPGLAVVQHSGPGKANQYFLRGYDLDHGTDMATFWDDVPINLPTNAHGQGYTDLNFLIPETVSGLEVRKGPYFADVGDFASAGDLHISLRDSVDQNIQSVSVGTFGYTRFLSLGSTKVGDGSLLYAGQFNTYDGPWTTPDDVRSFSGLLRYSQGTATDGLSVTAMAYSNTWNSSDQVALRAITTGQIGYYGELDPSDGGDSSRFMLSARMAQSDDAGLWKANAYVAKYTLNLFSNFTWDTTDPANGDQFHQHDDRIYTGGGVSRTIDSAFGNLPTTTVFGIQTRYDDINVGLSNTVQRILLSNTLVDHVNEGNAGIYAQNTVHWTDWLRTTAGWRGDYFATSVNSLLQSANSGNSQAAIGSPKFTAVFGPFDKTELFLAAGMGYHSNDARGVTVTETPGDPTTPESASPFLVRSRGAEIGVRTKAVPNLDSSISLFYLDQDSELFFDGDTGDTVAGLPSQRTGIEITNDYRPYSWVHVDANLALSRARFLGFDTAQEQTFQSLAGFPQAEIGSAPGNFIYNAPWMVASGGITLGEKTGWFSTLRWRYISSRPLTEDGAFQAPPLNTINGAVGYRFGNGWSVQLDALNLLNSTSYNASYAYGALLTSDSLFHMCASPTPPPAAVCANGVMDYSVHPMDPLSFRFTLAGPIDTIDVPGMAAELKRAIPAYQAPAANYDWTGFYVGAHANSTWSKTTGSTINTATGVASAPIYGNPSSWHGGIQVGYDYMMPSRVVLGIEADVDSGKTKVATTTDASGTSALQTRIFDSETVRGRLGYATDSVLLYGTGGWAWSSNQYVRTQLTGTLNLATAGTDEAVNTYLSGWTAGAGVAFAFAQNWNVFGEYRYTRFGSSNITLPFSQLSTTSTTNVSGMEFGVNYKFNGSAPSRSWAAAIYPGQPTLLYKARPASSICNWTGFYVGIDGGYSWGTSNGTLTTAAGVPLAPYSYGVNGPFAGGFIGGNYQFNQLVVGVEGDWQRSRLTGNSQELAPLGAAGVFPGGPFIISTTITDYGSLRARVGFAFDRFLAFGTAGWAFGNPSLSYALLRSAPFVTNGGNSSGWTVGAGVDYAFTDNVFGRIEYRYTNLETSGFVDVATDSADVANRVPISDVRVGVAYKFGAGPVVAQY
jgi:opacity protein-like surface antigen/outer membrane receptor protein involved in Fe transport